MPEVFHAHSLTLPAMSRAPLRLRPRVVPTSTGPAFEKLLCGPMNCDQFTDAAWPQ